MSSLETAQPVKFELDLSLLGDQGGLAFKPGPEIS